MSKEIFQELFEEFTEEHGREPDPEEINNAYIEHYASWADHLRDEAKYE
jgi:hypothetical protein